MEELPCPTPPSSSQPRPGHPRQRVAARQGVGGRPVRRAAPAEGPDRGRPLPRVQGRRESPASASSSPRSFPRFRLTHPCSKPSPTSRGRVGRGNSAASPLPGGVAPPTPHGRGSRGGRRLVVAKFDSAQTTAGQPQALGERGRPLAQRRDQPRGPSRPPQPPATRSPTTLRQGHRPHARQRHHRHRSPAADAHRRRRGTPASRTRSSSGRGRSTCPASSAPCGWPGRDRRGVRAAGQQPRHRSVPGLAGPQAHRGRPGLHALSSVAATRSTASSGPVGQPLRVPRAQAAPRRQRHVPHAPSTTSRRTTRSRRVGRALLPGRPARPTPRHPRHHAGVPLFAQLRRYTLATIAAAETAANFAAVIYTDAPANGEADPLEPMDEVELEQRSPPCSPAAGSSGRSTPSSRRRRSASSSARSSTRSPAA